MMWLIRAGKNAAYYDNILSSKKVFLPWDGYDFSFDSLETMADYRNAVISEKKINNSTAISTWAGQMRTFAKTIQIGDYVLIPSRKSHFYLLAKVNGPYQYDQTMGNCMKHSHSIDIIVEKIPREIFNQQIQFSLGAYRTVFRIKFEDDVMKTIEKWQKELFVNN